MTMNLSARLRDIEKKLDPSTKTRRPREIHESLQQVKAVLELNTSAEWVLTSDKEYVRLRVIPRGEKPEHGGLSLGRPFIFVETYNNAWPATLQLHTPPALVTIGLDNPSADWVKTSTIVHNAKELFTALGDFLDSPLILDWLKVQR